METINILYCGNLGLCHELETIIRSVHTLNHEVNLKLTFVGTGKAKNILEDLAQELKVDNVRFRQPVPLYKLPDLLSKGDIHLVSQKMGTQGLLVPSKIYGILAVGRPILFIGPFDCEVASIIIRSGAGIITRPGDINGVAEALRRLVMNKNIREAMGRNGRDYYKKHFGRNKSISQIIKAIESII